MKHKIISATWKSPGAIEKVVSANEKVGWSVAGMGDVFGGSILVLIRDGSTYNHRIIQIFWSLKEKLSDILKLEEDDGWQIAALGECLGSTLLILKKPVKQESSPS